MTTTATVSISLDEFMALQEAKQTAERMAAQLQTEISQQKIEASDKALFEIARASFEIVRFAVGNLPPESTKHWPTSALRVIAHRLSQMPDAGPDDAELALTLERFADECDVYERRGKILHTR